MGHKKVKRTALSSKFKHLKAGPWGTTQGLCTLCQVRHHIYAWKMTYWKLFWANPVIFRKLNIKLNVEIPFLKRIAILWHSFTSDYTNTTWNSKRSEVIRRVLLRSHSLSMQFCFPSLGSVNRTTRVALSAEESQKHKQRNPYQLKPTWFNYFSRRIFNHNLTSIKVLKCELKSTQCFNKSNLVCHMQIIHIPMEHLENKGDVHSSTRITTPPDSLLRVHYYLSLKFNVRATAFVWSELDSTRWLMLGKLVPDQVSSKISQTTPHTKVRFKLNQACTAALLFHPQHLLNKQPINKTVNSLTLFPLHWGT